MKQKVQMNNLHFIFLLFFVIIIIENKKKGFDSMLVYCYEVRVWNDVEEKMEVVRGFIVAENMKEAFNKMYDYFGDDMDEVYHIDCIDESIIHIEEKDKDVYDAMCIALGFKEVKNED